MLRLRLRDPGLGVWARGPEGADDAWDAANLVVSVWSHDPHFADSLVGVAQIAPADVCGDRGGARPFSTLVTLHGRAMGVLHGTLELLRPDHASFRGARRRRSADEARGLAFDAKRHRAGLLRLSHGTLVRPMPRPSLRRPADLEVGRSGASFRRSVDLSAASLAAVAADDDAGGAAGDDDDGFPMIAASETAPPRHPRPWAHTWTDADFAWVADLAPVAVDDARGDRTPTGRVARALTRVKSLLFGEYVPPNSP